MHHVLRCFAVLHKRPKSNLEHGLRAFLNPLADQKVMNFPKPPKKPKRPHREPRRSRPVAGSRRPGREPGPGKWSGFSLFDLGFRVRV